MPSAITAKRKNDAVLSVVQDNERKRVVIEQANMAIERLTGYSAEELVGKDFESLLPEREKDMLRSYIEYDDGDSDLATVLRKMLSFHLISKDGDTLLVGVKVFYGISEEAHKVQFELLLRDISLLGKVEVLRESLSRGGSVDDEGSGRAGLMSREIFMKDLHVIHKAVSELGVDACFAVFKVDGLDEIVKGRGELKERIISSTGRLIKESCRDEDIIGHITNDNIVSRAFDDYVGVVLFDCPQSAAKVVFNRIRLLRSSSPLMYEGQQYDMTVSSAYLPIESDSDLPQLVERCLQALESNVDAGANRIYEA